MTEASWIRMKNSHDSWVKSESIRLNLKTLKDFQRAWPDLEFYVVKNPMKDRPDD